MRSDTRKSAVGRGKEPGREGKAGPHGIWRRSAARRRRGATLLDSLGYLIIAAIVTAGVGYQMAKAAERSDRLEFLTAIETARTNLAQLKQAAAPAALNLDVDQMIALGVLPSSLADLARDSVGLATAWGSIGLNVSNSSMQLSLDSLTQEQCFWMARGLKAGATLSARGLDLAGRQPTVQETFEACGRQPILVWKL